MDQYSRGSNFSYIGHSRLVTNGSYLDNDNNQPVLKDDLILFQWPVVNHVAFGKKLLKRRKVWK